MLIRETSRQLTWLLLTKRPENLLRLVPEDILLQSWIGTTVEDQRRAEERIPRLLATPASVRFVSCEPLLEAVSLASWLGSEQISWVIVGGESGGHARPFEVRWARILLQQCRDAGVPFFMKQLGSNVQHPNSDAWTRDPVRIEHQGTAPYHRVLLCARAGENPHEWPEDLRVREWPQ
jgi:protein gp37